MQTWAAPAFTGDVPFFQEDGSSFTGYTYGDEYFHYCTDANGFLIQMDPSDNNWKYIVSDGSTLSFGNLATEAIDSDSAAEASILSDEAICTQYTALTGGEVNFTITGTNFSSEMRLQVFDAEGNAISDEWAKTITSWDEDTTEYTERTASLNFPANTEFDSKNYTIKITTDGGTSYLDNSLQITVGGAVFTPTTLTDDENGIRVKGDLEEDTTLVVTNYEAEDSITKDMTLIAGDTYSLYKSMRIDLTGTYEINYTDNLQISFSISEDMIGKNVLLLQETSSGFERFEFVPKDAEITLDTSSLSSFGIFVKKDEHKDDDVSPVPTTPTATPTETTSPSPTATATVSPTSSVSPTPTATTTPQKTQSAAKPTATPAKAAKSSTPKTGDNSNILPLLVIMGGCLLVGGCTIKMKKKQNINK